MKKINFNSEGLQKGLGVAGAVVMGVIAVANALSDQKEKRELKEMKEFYRSLKEKES